MGPGLYRTEIRRGVKRGHSVSRPGRNQPFVDSVPVRWLCSPERGVMKWQTCQTQNLVGGNARVGSSPTAGKESVFEEELDLPAVHHWWHTTPVPVRDEAAPLKQNALW